MGIHSIISPHVWKTREKAKQKGMEDKHQLFFFLFCLWPHECSVTYSRGRPVEPNWPCVWMPGAGCSWSLFGSLVPNGAAIQKTCYSRCTHCRALHQCSGVDFRFKTGGPCGPVKKQWATERMRMSCSSLVTERCWDSEYSPFTWV